MTDLVWMSVVMAFLGILFFMFVIVRGVPLRMGIARMRHKTFLIVDNDTHYTAPAIRKENPETIETKDGRTFGKTFRIKHLNGIRIGLAIPNEFVMVEAPIAAAVEADNAETDNPDDYTKMEDSPTKVMYNGVLVKLSELTKGLTKQRSPVLIKAAMSRAAAEAVAAKEREPAKWGMFVLLACIGVGVLLILLSKAGLW